MLCDAGASHEQQIAVSCPSHYLLITLNRFDASGKKLATPVDLRGAGELALGLSSLEGAEPERTVRYELKVRTSCWVAFSTVATYTRVSSGRLLSAISAAPSIVAITSATFEGPHQSGRVTTAGKLRR